jgi:hypothetical protein
MLFRAAVSFALALCIGAAPAMSALSGERRHARSRRALLSGWRYHAGCGAPLDRPLGLKHSAVAHDANNLGSCSYSRRPYDPDGSDAEQWRPIRRCNGHLSACGVESGS